MHVRCQSQLWYDDLVIFKRKMFALRYYSEYLHILNSVHKKKVRSKKQVLLLIQVGIFYRYIHFFYLNLCMYL